MLTTTLVALPAAPAQALDNAPGAPGTNPTWAPANKTGFGTSKTTDSKVWFTLQDGGMSEVYYPDLGTPSVRDLRFVVSDGSSFTERDSDSTQSTKLVDPKALIFQQTDTAKSGKWRLTKTYVTDPARPTVLMDVKFESLTGQPYQLYALYNPRLGNSGAYGSDDIGWTSGDALVAQDNTIGSALAASPAFTATSTGYQGTSDGWSDLRSDNKMDWQYEARQRGGNIVQTARLAVTGVSGSQSSTVALGFGGNADAALSTARSTLSAGYAAVSAAYASGWHDYVSSLKPPPPSLVTQREKDVYNASVMILASHEDKTNRGAFVASPTMPWAWGTNPNLENPSGAYHLVWARDVSGKAGGLLTAGDPAAAERALNYLFTKQQKSDGSFPQNSTLDGREHWTNTQMDEVAAPIILAWTLGKKDADTWSHVRAAADYIIGNGPITKQERWENQGGYSPATIAAEIAGLVCAADIAKANGDTAKQQAYLAKADDWQSHLKGWTVTTNGPYSSKPYFLRITKNGDPNNGTTYDVGDSGPNNADQRAVVDPSFLETVRLGVLAPDDPDILNTIPVVDQQLGENTPNGQFWHRYNWDGYGEQRNGGEWNFGFQPNSQTTVGRLWPLFAGERGEYELAAGKNADARLAAMAAASTEAGLLGEQVWDHVGPGAAGTPTYSATPLGWAHGQFVRLAWSIAAGRSLSTPSIVACRYLHTQCDGNPQDTPPGAPGKPVASDITSNSVKLTWTAATAGTNSIAGYDVYRDGDKVASVTGLSATITGLSPKTTYSFTVKAKDSTGLTGPASPATSVTTTAGSSTSCKVTYSVQSDWGTGFTAGLTITNTGTSPLSNWKLGFSFAGGQQLSNGWAASWSQSGAQVTATAPSYSSDLAVGASVEIGFIGSYSGANPNPTTFTVNGATCNS
ncbi:glucoamylase [Microbispora sp. SCL1-1]|uniref:glycoside hydrolase family 15 protein n=1 Tax=Microbispora TaxID=2005 RepID=UPI00115B7AE6|nr:MULTISPECIES: glycoside hydrolase family 15 protein [unclassified Microbispora]NJP30178.1 glucoamylase [Microbispora sp. CL1-1]TQS02587.1 glucoamylase [Microbispora sp. SCL1-1]